MSEERIAFLLEKMGELKKRARELQNKLNFVFPTWQSVMTKEYNTSPVNRLRIELIMEELTLNEEYQRLANPGRYSIIRFPRLKEPWRSPRLKEPWRFPRLGRK